MTLRNWVCFDTRFLRVRYGVKWTQPARLLDTTKFSDAHSSPFEASTHPKLISNKPFNWPVLLNLASKTDQNRPILAYFWPNHFLSQIQQNWLVIQSHWVSDNTSSWFNIWESSYKENSHAGEATKFKHDSKKVFLRNVIAPCRFSMHQTN